MSMAVPSTGTILPTYVTQTDGEADDGGDRQVTKTLRENLSETGNWTAVCKHALALLLGD